MKNIAGTVLAVAFFSILISNKAYALTGLHQIGTAEKNVTVAWDASPGTELYKVSCGKNTFYTAATSAFVASLKPDSKVTVKVAEVTGDGSVASGASVKCTTLPDPSQADICLQAGQIETAKGKSKVVSYRMVFSMYGKQKTSVSGYDYLIYNPKGKLVKKLTNQDNLFFYITGAKEKYYKIKLRSFKDLDSRFYSEWKTVYVFRQPLCQARRTGNAIQIKWEKIKKAKYYDIYVGTSKNGKFKKVQTVKGSKSMTNVTKVGGKSLVAGKTYYYYVIARTGNIKSYVNYVFNVQ